MTQEKLVSAKMIQAAFDIPHETLMDWVRKGCPHKKLGQRTYRFCLPKVTDWLEKEEDISLDLSAKDLSALRTFGCLYYCFTLLDLLTHYITEPTIENIVDKLIEMEIGEICVEELTHVLDTLADSCFLKVKNGVYKPTTRILILFEYFRQRIYKGKYW